MESRIRRLFLNMLTALALGAGPGTVSITFAAESDQVIRPEIERREVREADIDTEDFEIGVFYGLMNVEDFGTNPVYGQKKVIPIKPSRQTAAITPKL